MARTAKQEYERKLLLLEEQIQSVTQLLQVASMDSISDPNTTAVLSGLKDALVNRRERMVALWARFVHTESVDLNNVRIELANERWLAPGLPDALHITAVDSTKYSVDLIAETCSKLSSFVKLYLTRILQRTLTIEHFFTFENCCSEFWFRCPECHLATHHAAYRNQCVVQCSCGLRALFSNGVVNEFINRVVECENCGHIPRCTYANDLGDAVCNDCGGICKLAALSDKGSPNVLYYRGPLGIHSIVEYLHKNNLRVSIDIGRTSALLCYNEDLATIIELIGTLHESGELHEGDYGINVGKR